MNPPTAVDLSDLAPASAADALTYFPRSMDAERWREVRERVLRTLPLLNLRKAHDVRRAVRLLGVYFAALADDGLDVDDESLEVLFDPDRIESYVIGKRAYLATQHELRYFRVWGRELNPLGTWSPGTPVTTHRPRQDPLTADQVKDLLAAITNLRRGKSRQRLTLLVNLVLGCGASPTEITRLGWDNFDIDGGGRMIVRLPGGSARATPLPPRQVVAAAPYRTALAKMANERSGRVINAKDVNHLSMTFRNDAKSLRGIPRVTLTLLRTTWMVERAQAGVHWTDLAVAAGIAAESLIAALDGHVEGYGRERQARLFARKVWQ